MSIIQKIRDKAAWLVFGLIAVSLIGFLLMDASVGNRRMAGATSGTTAGTSTVALPVNVNTASAEDMRQALHISSVTAQKIITYRLQHGPFTSVEELSQVVSKTIYKKIEGEVTVS